MIGNHINSTLVENDQTLKQRAIYTSKGLGFQNPNISKVFPKSILYKPSIVQDKEEFDRGEYLSLLAQSDKKLQVLESYTKVIDGEVSSGFGFKGETVDLNYSNGPKFDEFGKVDVQELKDSEWINLSDKPGLYSPNPAVNGFTGLNSEDSHRSSQATSNETRHNKQFGSANTSTSGDDSISKYFTSRYDSISK